VTRLVLLAIASLAVTGAMAEAQASLRVEESHLEGPRALADQTAKAVIQDYIESWQTLRTALDQNRVDVLDRDFVGTAKDKLAETIVQQAKAGIHTNYQDRSHDVQIVFYSPEGLSIELTDNVEYEEQVLEKEKPVTTHSVHAHYVVMLSPSETRWKVRILQAGMN